MNRLLLKRHKLLAKTGCILFFSAFSFYSCSDSEQILITPEEITPEESVSDYIEESVTEVTSSDENISSGDYIDNKWAAFLVSPELPAYTSREQGEEILDVFCQDSIIGNVASLSRKAEPPKDTVIYNTKVITAGGPVGYDSLAYGKLSEVPDSFLNALTQQMKTDLGDGYGEHSSGSGMGYRTFYQASYDVDTGELQANQYNGYWARTLGVFSEHCAGVAVDFDLSYYNSNYLEGNGKINKSGSTEANREFEWLADNAHKYGFIWRYKVDGADATKNGHKTGTIYEGWHWRFVGVYHASQFWSMCAADTDSDGIPDAGYEQNDDYVWEDYYYEYISDNPSYPENEYDAICNFYNSPDGNKCTYNEYQEMISDSK